MYDPFLLLVFDFHDVFVDVMVFRKNKIYRLKISNF